MISMLRMLRSPPEEEVFAGMLGMLHDIVAHPTATPESVAWLCTPAVTELCMVMVTDPFRPSCLKLVELMMTAATELGPVALRTLVQHATTHDTSRYFGETLLRTMNEAELDGESPLPVGYRPAVTVRAQPRPCAVSAAAPPFFSDRYRAVQVLGFMHATASSANFLFPADQKILLVRPCHRPSHLPRQARRAARCSQDVLLRHMASIPMQAKFDEIWLAWIAAVAGIVQNSTQYKEGGLHKANAILGAMRTLRDELPEGEAKKSATAKVNDLLPLLGVAEASTYQGVGSGYGSKQ